MGTELEVAVERPPEREVPSLTLSDDPAALVAQAAKTATVLADVINSKGLFKTIGGKKHVLVEGWTTLLAMRGCLPREESVEQREDGSYVATVAYVQMSTGQVVTRASAECGGPDETLWQERHPNARRSMAVTRAAGKAARLAYSWIMTLAGYEATPAEEMEAVAVQRESQPPVAQARPRQNPAPVKMADGFGFVSDTLWRGVIEKVVVGWKGKDKNNKDSTAWNLIGTGGTRFGTFSESFKDIGDKFAASGAVCEIFYETRIKEKDGKKYTNYDIVNIQAFAGDEPPHPPSDDIDAQFEDAKRKSLGQLKNDMREPF